MADPFDFLGNIINAGASLFSGSQNRATQERIAQQNIDMQREFAQSGIRWKVADAQAAGVHPLFALGANTQSFSPVSVGTDNSIAEAGQSIGRAVSAMKTGDEKAQHNADTLTRLQLEKAGLENDVLRAELQSKVTAAAPRTAGNGPGMPSPDLPRNWLTMVSGGPDRSVGGLAIKEDDIKQKAEDVPATKIVRPFGYPLRANPWFNDGQQFEDRYGDSEIGSTIKFGVNTLADHFYSGYHALPEFRPQYGTAWRKRLKSRPWGE